MIYGIGEAFLQYADKFKLYSSFCVIHSRIIHMLQPGNRQTATFPHTSNIANFNAVPYYFSSGSSDALEEFLNARNPKQQHSCKLESYLIKPIQVVQNGCNELLHQRINPQ